MSPWHGIDWTPAAHSNRASLAAQLIAVAPAFWCGGVVWAQPILDLGAAPGPLVAGQGESAKARAAWLRESAEAIAFADGSFAGVKVGLRRLAAALIDTGEAAGEEGSARVIAGYTLARRLAEFDAAADAIAGPASAAERALIEADLRSSVSSLGRRETPPSVAVRAALAGLASGPQMPAADELLVLDGMDPVSGAAAQRLLLLCAQARSMPPFADSGGLLEQSLRDAIVALRSLRASTPQPQRERLAAALGRAVIALDVSPSDSAATATLRDVAFLERVGRIASRQTSASLRRAIEASADRAWAGERVRVAESLRRLCDLIERGDGPRDEALIRPLRPAAKLLRLTLRETDAGLAAALAVHDAMNPALATAVTARTRALDDLRRLERVSEIVAGSGDSPSDAWKGAAEAALAAAREAARPGATRQPLVDFIHEISLLGRLAGEGSLRAEAERGGDRGAWRTLTGLEPASIVRTIDDTRMRWLAGLDPRKRIAPDIAARDRLAALAEVMDALADVAHLVGDDGEFGASGAAMRLAATPEWELHAASLETMSRPALAELARACAEAVAGNPDAARAALANASGGILLARLAGRLAARAPEPLDPWREVIRSAGGSTTDADSARLAAICRYAEECARLRSEGAASVPLEAWLAARAREALERVVSPD